MVAKPDSQSGSGARAESRIRPEGTEPAAGSRAAETSLNLNEVAIALAEALNLVGIEDAGHGKRVAFIATETGRAAGLPADELDLLFVSALLHDCGVSSSRVFRKLTASFDWEGSAEHCLAGHRLLFGFPPFRTTASIVLHHHDRWDVPGRSQVEPRIALLSNTIFLADRADVLCLALRKEDILMARGGVRDGISRRSRSYFAPDLVGAFLEASLPEAFWLTLEERHLDRYIDESKRATRPETADFGRLRQLAAIFAQIVDAKSPFTAHHSLGVARLARLLGSLLGMSPEVCDQLEIAGLLHDLGKLRVPDEILEKAGPLDDRELSTMTRHAFETYQILRRLGPFRDLSVWASFHHESLTGRGYPFHRHGLQIPFPARALAVADVFQALLQRRPYRPSLAPESALALLREMAGGGKLDPEIVETVARNLEACRAAAAGEAPRDAASAGA